MDAATAQGRIASANFQAKELVMGIHIGKRAEGSNYAEIAEECVYVVS